ncbi:MAG: thiamine pyrophosphate-dependent enzyme [Nitrospirae bacterium]|nr:thiamine pyrophosphate-dependent enzyme [Nitrospirota bacterium]MCL5976729.1 thiamine pyrophosphate-dependent enzyme [Nitrospirota bacterium]
MFKEGTVNMKADIKVSEEIIRNRLSQMIINEMCKKKEFKIPIHLALGHESIAVAVSAVMEEDDRLVLTHRNIHYNLARNPCFKAEIDEYLLKSEGLAGGRLGAMNLANERRGIVYTSSILGNNLSVAAGMALGKKVKEEDGIVIVVTGDGAMEEGAFYEGVTFLKTCNLNAIVIVENNEWSLATRIQERRCPIHLDRFASSLDVDYVLLTGNDVYAYITALKQARREAIERNAPVIIEVKLRTLGDWRLKTEEYPDGKFINYHAGASPSIEVSEWPLIREDDSDPVFVLSRYFEIGQLRNISCDMLNRLTGEIQ